MTTLKEEFILSGGSPLRVGNIDVIQMDVIPVGKAKLIVSVASAINDQGIALKAPKGSIQLSDGKKVSLLHIWFDEGLPTSVTHNVDCGNEGLKVWNIYRTHHPGGLVTEEAWTGNAGMTISESGPQYRRYYCSPGNAYYFDPQLDVLMKWEEVIET